MARAIRGVICNGTKFKCFVERSYRTVSSPRNLFRSPYPDLDIINESLPGFLFKKLDQFPNKIAVIDAHSRKTYTFSQVKSYAIKVASGFRKLGFQRGDVIAVHATNCAEYIILLLALIANGITITGTNPAFTTGELTKCLELTDASCVVTMSPFLPVVNAAVTSTEKVRENIKHIMTIEDVSGYRSVKSLMGDDGSSFPKDFNFDLENDIAALLFSSGTSGFPKPVMLNHRSLVANLQLLHSSFDMVTPDDNFLAVLPFFHGFGMVVISFYALYGGNKVVTMSNFDFEVFLQSLQDEKISFLHLVPPIALLLAKHPLAKRYNLSNIQNGMCAAAPLGATIQRELIDKYNMSLFQAYGMTEFIAGLVDKEPLSLGTVGKPVSNCICKIVDHETKELVQTVGDSGEICMKGPQLMKGYLNDIEATNRTIKDGWIHTGDVGYLNEDGNVVITDRVKDLIKYNAYQVAPAELEHILLKHEDIQDAAVIGIQDDKAGEVPRAYVVPKPNSSLNAKKVQKFIEYQVADYKRLRGGVVITNEIPKSASGKILRRILKNEFK